MRGRRRQHDRRGNSYRLGVLAGTTAVVAAAIALLSSGVLESCGPVGSLQRCAAEPVIPPGHLNADGGAGLRRPRSVAAGPRRAGPGRTGPGRHPGHRRTGPGGRSRSLRARTGTGRETVREPTPRPAAKPAERKAAVSRATVPKETAGQETAAEETGADEEPAVDSGSEDDE